jgi:hypothetical protein
MSGRIDTRGALAMVDCPVLVQHRADESLAWAAADLSAGLRRAEGSTVDGCDHPVWVGDVASYVAPIPSFLLRHSGPVGVIRRRRLMTLLFADVGATGRSMRSQRSSVGRHGRAQSRLSAITSHGSRASPSLRAVKDFWPPSIRRPRR